MFAVLLEHYGDFDIPVADSLWIHEGMEKKASFDIKTLGDFGDDKTPNNLIKALKAHGFKRHPHTTVIYGGNY